MENLWVSIVWAVSYFRECNGGPRFHRWLWKGANSRSYCGENVPKGQEKYSHDSVFALCKQSRYPMRWVFFHFQFFRQNFVHTVIWDTHYICNLVNFYLTVMRHHFQAVYLSASITGVIIYARMTTHKFGNSGFYHWKKRADFNSI